MTNLKLRNLYNYTNELKPGETKKIKAKLDNKVILASFEVTEDETEFPLEKKDLEMIERDDVDFMDLSRWQTNKNKNESRGKGDREKILKKEGEEPSEEIERNELLEKIEKTTKEIRALKERRKELIEAHEEEINKLKEMENRLSDLKQTKDVKND